MVANKLGSQEHLLCGILVCFLFVGCVDFLSLSVDQSALKGWFLKCVPFSFSSHDP